MLGFLTAFFVGSLAIVNAQQDECESPLFFTEFGGGNCRDGSRTGFYSNLDLTQTPSPDLSSITNYVLWLGASDLCGSEEQCNSFCDLSACSEDALNGNTESFAEVYGCYFRSLTCTSNNWPKTTSLCGTSILDYNNLQILDRLAVFYMPPCNMDWFLGEQSPFSGSVMFEQMITLLRDQFSLSSTKRLIFGGNGGGGVAAANLVRKVREFAGLETLQIDLLLDSSFTFTFPEFSVTEFSNQDLVYSSISQMNANIANWAAASFIDESCKDSVGNVVEELGHCLLLSYLFQNSDTFQNYQNINLMLVQSEYDILQMASLGVLDPTKTTNFVDSSSYTTNLIAFIESFGGSARAELNTSFSYFGASDTNRVFLATSPCGQNAPLSPNTLLRSNWSQTITFEESSPGTIINRQIPDGGLSSRLSPAVEAFISGDYSSSVLWPMSMTNVSLSYPCKTFACDIQCTQNVQVVASVVEFNLSTETRTFIVFLAIGLIAAGWVLFIWTYLKAALFNKLYVSAKKPATTESDFVALVGNRPNIISVCVKNYRYFVPKDNDHIEILKGVDIAVKPGALHAIMGPSGSGKTTLLDILANLRRSGRYSGTHMINGVPSNIHRAGFLKQYLKNNMGYVKQQDVLFETLTVKESLIHSAWLSLPESLKAKEKLRRVFTIAAFLGLDSVLDTKIGKISGGQKKRVSVATQLLPLPSMLVLDEPTTGLDATNALVLCDVLYKLAHIANMAILMTIHQPRREIFALMDKLTILVSGKIAFSGSPPQAAKFFRVNLDEVNIGNDILDKLEDYKASKHSERALLQICETYDKSFLGQVERNHIASEESYLTKKMASTLETHLKRIAKANGAYSWTKPTSSMLTMKVILNRTLVRGAFDIGRSCAVALVGGLLVASVYVEVSGSYTNTTSLAYLSIASMTFLQATFLGDRYQLEKGMWSHETASGTPVSWTAFLLSQYQRNCVASTLEAAFFAIPLYLIALSNDFNDTDTALLFLLIIVLTSWAVVSQNTLVEIDRIRAGGVSGPDLRQAALINMTLLSLGVLFNGFIIQLKDIPSAIAWVPFVMLTFWGFVGILGTLFRDFTFPCGPDDNLSVLECATRTGDFFLQDLEYDRFDTFQCLLALMALICVFHVLGSMVFFLRFVKRGDKLTREGTVTKAHRDEGYSGETMGILVNNKLNIERKNSKLNFFKTRSKSKDTEKERKKSSLPDIDV